MASLPTILVRRLWSMLGLGAYHRRPVLAALRITAGAALCMAVVAPQAAATCGDWLAHPLGAVAMDLQSAQEQSADPVASPVEKASHSQQPSPASPPCHGPFCGQAPTAPLAPLPVRLPTISDQFANVVGSAAGEIADRQYSHPWPHDASPLAGFVRRIEHPPRA
jgi:hypothetical protein